MSTDWSLDFCIVCDRQTLGGAYCSQACRLAEIDQYATSESEPSSPTSTTGFNLPWLAPNRVSGRDKPLSTLRFAASKALQVHTTFSSISDIFSKPSRTTLTPSSSQTSLSSLSSSSSAAVILSGQAKSELEEYAGYFDQVRDWKRRLTVS